MSWFTDLFKKEKNQKAASSAKDRLTFVLRHDRQNRDSPDFVPQLRQEIIEVIKKYVPIFSEEQVKVDVSSKDSTSIMEVSISLDPKYDNEKHNVQDKYSSEDDLEKIKPVTDK
jgi:cell division topological specificity factor